MAEFSGELARQPARVLAGRDRARSAVAAPRDAADHVVLARKRAVRAHPAGPCASALIFWRASRIVASACVPPPRRMIHRRARPITRPGRPIRWNRSAFMRLAAQLSPSAKRFIAAFRLNARIASAHHAALAPNSPGRQRTGQIGFHRRMRLLALATTLSQPPDDAVAGTLPVGHHAKQLVQALAGERLGGKRQLLLVPQFADFARGFVQELQQRLVTRQRPRSSSATAGMNAFPATALGELDRRTAPASPTAPTARASPVRARAASGFSATAVRRAKANPSRLPAGSPKSRCRAPTVRCPPRNPRPQSSGRSPPEPSGCRASPAAGRPNMPPDRPAEAAGLDQIKIKGRPAKRSGHGWMGRPRTGNRAAPVPPSRTPLVMVFGLKSKTIS